MLNEGYVLYESLKSCGVIESKSFIREHPEIRNPGKKDGLVIGINENGNLTSIEFRNADEISRLWTTAKGNHNSFPVYKLQRPLYKVESDDPIREKFKESNLKEAEKKEILVKQDYPINITKNDNDKWNNLQKRVNELQPFFKTTDRNYIVIYELMGRFKEMNNWKEFITDLIAIVKNSQTNLSFAFIENLLIGKKIDETKNEYKVEIPIVFEVSDWYNENKFLNRIASNNSKLRFFISSCLFKYDDAKIEKGLSQKSLNSALTGEMVTIVKDKFPESMFGNIKTYIFSANKNIPALTRYKQISTDIIPIGKDEANSINDSLRWITKAERGKKTWIKVPSGMIEKRNGKNVYKDDILIAYLENKPDSNINQAYLLGGVSVDDFSDTDYESVSKIAINAMRGLEVRKIDENIRMFCLRKADPGRTQVSLQRTYTVQNLFEANDTWHIAAKNHPEITIPFFKNEIKKAVTDQKNISTIVKDFLQNQELKSINVLPKCPFPADLVRLTQRQWIRGGLEFSLLPGFTLGDIYDVYFAKENEEIPKINDLLERLLHCTKALLIGLGVAEHKKELKGINIHTRFTFLRTISAIGICLYKLGFFKENYMKDTFYYVGRFLSLLDTLHYEWCKNVRDGNIPPQLLGNSHLQIALDNPVSAIDILSRRINVYQAWTRKEKSDKVKLARWVMGEIGAVANLLSEKTLPTSTTSVERAQILLGYLSREEKKSESDLKLENNVID